MTDEELTSEFTRLNEQMTALVSLVSNIEAVIDFKGRAARKAHYVKLMEACEAGTYGISGARLHESLVSNGVDTRDEGGSGLEGLELTSEQLEAVQAQLTKTNAREVLEQKRKASRQMKKGKRRGK